jgi:hypothetical protein
MKLLSINEDFNRDEYLGYFSKNDAAIREDFEFLTADRKSNHLKSVNVLDTKIYLSKRELEFVNFKRFVRSHL